MALKGKNPAMNIVIGSFRCQGNGGISLGSFPLYLSCSVVFIMLLPVMPPITVRGKVTSAHSRKITSIVPKGRAEVEFLKTATVFRNAHITNKGPEKTLAATIMFQAHLSPPKYL